MGGLKVDLPRCVQAGQRRPAGFHPAGEWHADTSEDDRLFLRQAVPLSFAWVRSAIRAGVQCQDEHPKTGAAFGIGRSCDTSPRLGCCKVAGGSCGGNFLRMQRLTTNRAAHGSCAGNLRPPLGELVESTR